MRFDATERLAKSRGGPVGDGLLAWPVTVTWTEYGQPRVRRLLLPVTTTPQPLGGVRRWWQCPNCGRRCGVLLAASAEAPIGCRRCLGAVYLTDYPGRRRDRQLTALLGNFLADESLTLDARRDRELDALLGKRRRGIRRGRRVLRRALRRLAPLKTEPDVMISLLRGYGTMQLMTGCERT